MQAVRAHPLLSAVAAALVAAAAVALLARAAAHVYHDDALWSLAGWQKPGDLNVFLSAGDDVLAGRNPYPSGSELAGHLYSPYVYPPVLALVITPLSVLPVTYAATLFSLFSLACIVGALLLLGVRDWRCHAVAILNPFTRQAIEYGAVGPLLVLLAALCWRYRDRAPAVAAAAGGAAVVKLFLWPLAVWLALTRRWRGAALAVAVGVAAAFFSWAAIGFDGLTDYPHLLRRVVHFEAENSYSAVAVGHAIGLSLSVAHALAIALGLGLLAAAAWVARGKENTLERDRTSFILVLAAALALTPIVWVHYLVLLLVPLALARSRFSPLWLAPLLAWPFWIYGAYRGWANGELDDVLSIAGIVVIVFAGSLGAGKAWIRRETVREQAA